MSWQTCFNSWGWLLWTPWPDPLDPHGRRCFDPHSLGVEPDWCGKWMKKRKSHKDTEKLGLFCSSTLWWRVAQLLKQCRSSGYLFGTARGEELAGSLCRRCCTQTRVKHTHSLGTSSVLYTFTQGFLGFLQGKNQFPKIIPWLPHACRIITYSTHLNKCNKKWLFKNLQCFYGKVRFFKNYFK